ncbi:MAG: Hsp20/alpha crystallin family protein [Bacilli bacterium]|nr:Hsp20/alpha crystallin family protein [Bacilli bacterium]
MLPSIFNDMFDTVEYDDAMKCDIYEKDNLIHIELDVPGFDKNDINIELSKGNLIVTAKKEKIEEENKKYYRRERSFYGKYSRSFYLGDVEEDKIEASFKDGILVITVPKEATKENKKLIEIK